MNSASVKKAAKLYGIKVHQVLAPQKGYRNAAYPIITQGGQTVNFILFKSEPGIIERIARANRVANFVAEAGLPARQTLSSCTIKISDGKITKYGALYNYLPGNTIPWEAYSMERIKNLGEVMSRMHAILQSADFADLPCVAEECETLRKRMKHYFAKNSVTTALRQKTGLCVTSNAFSQSAMLKLCKKLPQQHALHMDFVRGNVLFNGANITGILDFEKVAKGHAIFDVARTLSFLTVDCKNITEVKVYKYFVHSGYSKRGVSYLQHIKFNNTSVLNLLVDFFLLYDFYKFLKHNPYESLKDNEHFVRTKTMLLKRGLISLC